MPKVIHSYPSDSEGYTHFILDFPYTGEVVADIDGVAYDHYVMDGVSDAPIHLPGDVVPQVSVGLQASREFELAGTVKTIHFDDGTTWTPGE